MKTISLLSLAALLAVAPMTASAQQGPAASSAAKPAQTCPCSDYRFVPKTDKAKAVGAWWEARRKYDANSVAGTVVGTIALFGVLAGGSAQGLEEVSDSMRRSEGELLSARDAAERLHGLEVTAREPAALVTVTLTAGVDYTFAR